MKKHTFIDLFAGAGGMAEGFYQEGYMALTHIELDKYACLTLQERMRHYGYHENEINKIKPTDITDKNIISIIESNIGKTSDIDVIIGGPPCQSFSSHGKARDPFSMKKDPRNYLYENYLNILNYFKPKFFVFENVSGILSTKIKGKSIIKDIFDGMKKNYNIIENKDMILLNAVDFGVPQDRKRIIIIGTRKDLSINPKSIYDELKNITKKLKKTTVRDAISDLPKLKPSEGMQTVNFNPTNKSSYLKLIRQNNYNLLHGHIARNHNELDRKRYRLMAKNKWDLSDLYKNEPSLIHIKKRLFNNSYCVQNYDAPSKTIIAHLYKDGNQFIHPDYTQERSITPREAARLQSFPDDFVFPCSITQQYKQIGNAVPPLMSKYIAMVLKKYL
ncbi:DNA cytosine methyltransferase [Campylobacter concisus]|jgi:modification methylase ddeI|uniref:Cytosine-specific methyltransferase n=1 Tax=Campylobacter concisus (strain 13826) TaxID=360104 RepID=A7ZBV2_CAMC1|nr:DNA cytosine methyltransferase [Campylobacter concisus]EAT98887.1 cytosine-specific DNA methyltransferase [Campylobacter concisus 13826]MBE8584608.1 DNA cytosine methyltransferase [Campylobacter concisus]